MIPADTTLQQRPHTASRRPDIERALQAPPVARVTRTLGIIVVNGLALSLAWLLEPTGRASTMTLFMTAVILSGLIGGRMAGLVATTIASWGMVMLTTTGHGSAGLWEDVMRVGGFGATGLLVNSVNSARKALHDAERHRSAAERGWHWLDEVLQRAAPPIFLVSAEDGRVLLANEAARDPSGGLLSECGGVLTADQGGGALEGLISQAAQGEMIRGRRVRLIAPSGPRWYLVSARRIRGLEDPETAVIVSCQETTELERVLTELQFSEARFRVLTEAAPVGIFHTDGHGRVMFANARWRALMGVRGEEDWLSRIHPEDAVRVREEWREAVDAGRHVEAEFRLPDQGVSRWLSLHAAPLSGAAGTPTYVGTLAEITEQRAAQEEMRRLAEHRAQLVATVSHSLRAPTTAMLLNLEFLADETAGPLTDEQQDHVRQSVAATEDLARTVDDLLVLSRIQSGAAAAAPTEGDFGRFLDGAVRRFEARASEKDVGIQLQVGPGCESVYLDFRQFDVVLTELLENALKYSEQRCDITVAARRDAQYLILRVEDTGPGIPPEERPHVFEPFFRGAAAEASQARGSGLGLQIVSQIVRLMGGAIEIDPNYTVGAALEVRVPVC